MINKSALKLNLEQKIIKNKFSTQNINNLIKTLSQNKIIAYPTESVFGLGCDPDSDVAIRTLLELKQRSWKKGLILVAAYYEQLVNYIDDRVLDDITREQIIACWPGYVTWTIPARPTISPLLKGQFSSLAVRVSSFEPIRRLCLAFGKPLVSTSANLTGQAPARTLVEVRNQFGINFPLMVGVVEGYMYPSEIRDSISGKLIRSS